MKLLLTWHSYNACSCAFVVEKLQQSIDEGFCDTISPHSAHCSHRICKGHSGAFFPNIKTAGVLNKHHIGAWGKQVGSEWPLKKGQISTAKGLLIASAENSHSRCWRIGCMLVEALLHCVSLARAALLFADVCLPCVCDCS